MKTTATTKTWKLMAETVEGVQTCLDVVPAPRSEKQIDALRIRRIRLEQQLCQGEGFRAVWFE